MSGPGAAPRKSDSAPWPRRTLSKLQRVVNDLTPKSRSKGRRSVDPDDPRHDPPRVAPGVEDAARVVEAVADPEVVPLALVQHHLERALQHVHELLALVGIAALAAGARLDREDLRLHQCLPVGQ